MRRSEPVGINAIRQDAEESYRLADEAASRGEWELSERLLQSALRAEDKADRMAGYTE